jgi:hypothetical protein
MRNRANVFVMSILCGLDLLKFRSRGYEMKIDETSESVASISNDWKSLRFAVYQRRTAV